MSDAPLNLSETLALLVDDFERVPAVGASVTLDAGEFERLIDILRTSRSLAANLELEVRLLRDMEAGREIRSSLDREAADQIKALRVPGGDNVVRPSFRKGAKP
ncbi:hypothetical protein D4A92_09600 [Rhizobium rosettiformans]|uniref:Uncharacterized protein n=1 Tax=Rhizobium rosettiformans TaxID=1368430 RepID=A0ABX7ETM3_9HYPH|nr:hypothetical protein [Rhizobium rosettiformans]QRF51672.1 hypothetical protein D4A92_09600 [Rhizobium rosettiformans]